MIYLKAAALALAAFLLGQLSVLDPAPSAPSHTVAPKWIGHDCEGAGGDVWAMELSDFPTTCKEIERN